MRAALVTILLVGAAAAPAGASTFSVKPTQVLLSPRVSSQLLTLRNESDEPLRFQLTAFAWDQSLEGEIVLSATEDVVFFPALVMLAPKEQRNIRIGLAAPMGTVGREKTYRLFVEELPPLQQGEAASSAVRVLTKMGIPIFVQPARIASAATLADLAVRAGRLTFVVRNTGNAHFIVKGVRVRGSDRAGRVLLDRSLSGWYVLAGGSRLYGLDVTDGECAALADLTVEAAIGTAQLSERITVPAACGR